MVADTKTSAAVAVPHRVLLVAPAPPPYGGMALQAQLLEKLIRGDGNSVTLFPSNFPFPRRLQFLDRFHGIRTLVRAAMIWVRLWRQVHQAEVVHVLAASWLYFFVVVCPAVILGRASGKRVILNYRGGEARRFFRWFGWFAAPIFQFAHVVTTPSEFLAEVIRDHFRVPVHIVSNLLDTSLFRYRERTTLQPKMVVARHLEKIYDIESVLKAFRMIQQHYPAASLWIAGTGSQENSLRSMVSGWNLNNIRFLGAIAHESLPAIYDECDIFLNASRVDNFPGALLEASAAGLAVISSCAGGIPFIYQNGKSALLVEPGDYEGLARAVEKLLQGSSLAREMIREAATLARRCDWKEVRRSMYEAYGFSLGENDHDGVMLQAGTGKGAER